MDTASHNQERYHGLDLLKAISIIFVLFWHLQPLRFKTYLEIFPYTLPAYTASILNTQMFLLGVPIFISVSLYLFYLKSSNNFSYFKSRVLRLLNLFVFWVSIQFIITFIATQSFTNTSSPLPFMKVIMMGGPILPIVGGSVFYYLFALLVITIVCYFYINIKNDNAKTLIGLFTIVFSLLYFELFILINSSIPAWRIDNFLIYIPMVYFFANSPDKVTKHKNLYLIGFLLFSAHDLFLKEFGFPLSYYGRISVFFGTLTFLSYLVPANSLRIKLVEFLSKFSLGIFALHKYFFLLVIIAFNEIFFRYNMSVNLEISYVDFNTLSFFSGIATIIATFLSVYLLNLTFLKRYIS
jgi:hypothetical protein